MYKDFEKAAKIAEAFCGVNIPTYKTAEDLKKHEYLDRESTNKLNKMLYGSAPVYKSRPIGSCGCSEAMTIDCSGFVSAVISKAPCLEIKEVIYNPPATIVFWTDGTKTVVKCGEYDTFDCEKGLAMAIAKKALGNKGSYYKVFRKNIPVEEQADRFLELKEEFNKKSEETGSATTSAIDGLTKTIDEFIDMIKMFGDDHK